MRFTLLILVVVAISWSAASAQESPRVSRVRVQSAIQELEKIANKTLQSTGVPGIAIAVVHGDDVVYKRGFGVREVGTAEPITGETVFQLASVSKPITSTVIARLVSEGRITWDDRVSDHDPAFEMYDPFVTRELRLRDLLCHRSGLPDHAGDLLEDMGYGKDMILHRLRYQPPDSSFRAGYAYTNMGYSEAGYASAKAVGKAWEELAAEVLFVPLGMKSTSYRYADYAAARNRALLHARIDNKWVAKYTREPDAQAPAGGVSSTLDDLAQWLRLQVGEGKFGGKQLIQADVLAETHKPQVPIAFSPEPSRMVAYGLGWNVIMERGGRAFYKHSGEFFLGVRTEVSIFPAENLAIAVLSNAAPTGVPEGLTESFFDLVLYGKPQRDWVEFANRMSAEDLARDLSALRDYSHPPAKPTPPLALSTYSGKYANEFYGEIEVAERQGQLVLRMGPKPLEFPLRHWDRDNFIYQPVGENALGPSGVRFAVDPGNQADRVLIEILDANGLGTLKRVRNSEGKAGN